MRGKIVLAGLFLGLSGIAAAAQGVAPAVPRSSDIYCSGIVTTEAVPHDTILITGEQSNYKIIFNEGDYVYINKGSDQGVKPGDEFSVVRAVNNATSSCPRIAVMGVRSSCETSVENWRIWLKEFSRRSII